MPCLSLRRKVLVSLLARQAKAFRRGRVYPPGKVFRQGTKKAGRRGLSACKKSSVLTLLTRWGVED